MAECVVECHCGRRMRVPDGALGGHGTCVHCGARLHLTEDRVWRPDAAGKDCPRCGQAFRGDWDRTRTAAGVLCQRCAHQYEPPPETAPEAPVYVNEDGPAPVMEPPDPDVEEAGVSDREKHRKLAVFLGLAAAGMVVYALLPLEAPVASLVAWLTPEPPELPPGSWLERLVVLDTLVWLAYQFATLYIALYWCGLLPNEDTRSNLIAVGAMAVVLYVLGLLGINHYLALAVWVVRMVLVGHVYDMGARDLARYIVVSVVLLPAAPIVQKSLHGILAFAAY